MEKKSLIFGEKLGGYIKMLYLCKKNKTCMGRSKMKEEQHK
jgi:hypothetical protein